MKVNAEDHMAMAYKIAMKFHEKNTGNDFEEIYSAALLGLAIAAKKFDPSKGLEFSTFAYPTIIGEIKMFYYKDRFKFRRRRINGQMIYERVYWGSLNETTGEDDSLEKVDLLEEKTVVEDCIDRLFVNSLLNSLDEMERKIILSTLYEEKTQAEAGKELGVSQITVSRIKRRALEKLRKQICA